jgi:hypothetical protein
MSSTKQQNQYFQDIRHLHRILAPIMLLPLLLTAITGTAYQIADLIGQGDSFDWLLSLHKGNFGSLHLDIVYPFLNALGLLVLLFTGISMWLNMKRKSKKRSV